MTLSAHVSIGSAVGLATGNPVAGFFAGWMTHHILDSIPHSDVGSVGANIETILKDKKGLEYVVLDIAVAFLIFVIFIIVSKSPELVFFGALGGAFPDIIDNSPFWSPYLRKIFPFDYFHKLHEFLHYTILDKKYFWIGYSTQIISITAAFIFLYTS